VGNSTVLISLLVPLLLGGYLLLTSTTTVIPGIWPYDAKRVVQIVMLLVLFSIPALDSGIRNGLGSQLAALPSWLKSTLITLAGIGVLSALINAESTMHALNSLSEVVLMSALLFSVFVVAACRRIAGRPFDFMAVGLLAMTGLAVGVQELLGVLAAHSGDVEFNFRISLLNYSWPRFYNQVQSWMVPVLTVMPALFVRSRLARALCLLVLGLQWYIIMMTGARGAFVSIAGAFFLVAIFIPILRKHLLTWQLAGFVFGALIYAAVAFSFQAPAPDIPDDTLQQQAQQEAGANRRGGFYGNEEGTKGGFLAQSLGRPMANTSGRSWMWKIAIQDAVNHPLLGIGPMNYVCTSSVNMGHPHNFLLQTAAEWGIPVALAFGFLFLYLLAAAIPYWRRQKREEPSDQLLGCLLLTGLVSAALYSCLSGVMMMPASQVTGLLLCGMLLGLVPLQGDGRASPAARTSFIPAVLASVALLALSWHELSTLEERAALLRPGEDMHPRIWQNAMVCRLYVNSTGVKN
jgi:hypothetical protein